MLHQKIIFTICLLIAFQASSFAQTPPYSSVDPGFIGVFGEGEGGIDIKTTGYSYINIGACDDTAIPQPNLTLEQHPNDGFGLTTPEGISYNGLSGLLGYNIGNFRIGTINNNAPLYLLSNGTINVALKDDKMGIGTGIAPLTHALQLRHGSTGFLLEENISGSDNSWELLTTSTGDLVLKANGVLRGTFAALDGAYTPSSDSRFKTNIRPMQSVLTKIMQLAPAQYQYIDNNPNQEQSLGFIAQEVKNIFPELVNTVESEADLHTVNYAGFSVVAIKAIQEQQALIEQQAQTIEIMKAELEAIKASLKK